MPQNETRKTLNYIKSLFKNICSKYPCTSILPTTDTHLHNSSVKIRSIFFVSSTELQKFHHQYHAFSTNFSLTFFSSAQCFSKLSLNQVKSLI